MTRFLWICLAGAVGTGLRYLVATWVPSRPNGLPVATVVVNLTGCFLMGLVAHFASRSAALSPDLRAAVTVGFLGGLTTYSAFNHETTRLLQDGAPRAARVYLSLTAFGCFAAGLAGAAAARRLTACH